VLTDIVVEEASEITKKDFDQLLARLRGIFKEKIPKTYKIERIDPVKIPFQITLLLNPISSKHWIKREFIDLKTYQKSMSVYILHSTYKDNEFLDPDYKDILEGYKETDRFFYDVYCLGEWGIVGNVVFNNWELKKCPYKEEDFDAVYYGMDFGSVHPSVIEKIGMKDGALYSFDELCVFDKTNMEFINANIEYDIMERGKRCKADSAEPARIKEWVQNGFGVIPAVKGPDSVTRGIDYIKNYKWYIDPDRCPRLAQEVEVYHWKEDKNGDPIEGKPVDIFDDGIKSVIYSLEDLSRSQGKPSVLSGTKSDKKKEILEIKKEERKKIREIKKAQAKKKREDAKKR
jgi:phage terminase large subunit